MSPQHVPLISKNCNIYLQLQAVMEMSIFSNFLDTQQKKSRRSRSGKTSEQEMQVCSTMNGTSKVHARAKDIRLSSAKGFQLKATPPWFQFEKTDVFEVEATV